MLLPQLLKFLPLPTKLKTLLLAHEQTIYFLIVGATAAAVHWLVATLAFVWGDIAPFIANLLGFVIALSVSIVGHTFLTFGNEYRGLVSTGHKSKLALTLTVFSQQALVSLGSFALNNVLLYVGTMLEIYFPVLLFIVLVLVAVLTFVFSKLIYKRQERLARERGSR